VKIKTAELMVRLALIVGAVVVFNIIRTCIAHSSVIASISSSEKLYESCSVPNTLWYWLPAAVEGVSLLYGANLAFAVRKTPADFNESKWIGFSLYNVLVVGSLLLILTQLVNASQAVISEIQAAGCLFVLTASMALVFGSRIYDVVFVSKHKSAVHPEPSCSAMLSPSRSINATGSQERVTSPLGGRSVPFSPAPAGRRMVPLSISKSPSVTARLTVAPAQPSVGKISQQEGTSAGT
jgi:hypothetical protein